MKQLLILLAFLGYRDIAICQKSDFPSSWEGKWSGQITILSSEASYEIPMSLSIQPIDKNRWTWLVQKK